MADQAALLRLMSWLSPAFPVGAFAYSHGLEQAIHDGLIRDRATLIEWLDDLIGHGSGWNDAVLLAEAWRAADDGAAVAELAEAMAGSRERHMETTLQGAAFGEAVGAWANVTHQHPLTGPSDHLSPCPGERSRGAACNAEIAASAPLPRAGGEVVRRTGEGVIDEDNHKPPYPVAAGLAAGRHGIALEAVLTAYLHAFTSNLIQASVRLVPLGQRDGVATLAALEPAIADAARRASASTLDDLGSCTWMSEIMSMRHETLYSRVFRS